MPVSHLLQRAAGSFCFDQFNPAVANTLSIKRAIFFWWALEYKIL